MRVVFADLLLCLLLGWASASDLRRRTIPNACTVLGSGALMGLATAGGPGLLSRGLAGLLAFCPLAAIAFVRPGSLGMGDAKLAGMIAVAVGSLAPAAISLGFLCALLATVPAVLKSGLRDLGAVTVPLAPHLSLGAVLVVALVQ